MGQYYRLAFRRHGEDNVVVNGRKYRGSGYISGKLMSTSYIGNFFVNAVCRELQRNPCRIVWVGDYTEDDELAKTTNGEVSMEMVYGSDPVHRFGSAKNFSYRGKYLVNLTKGVYISFDEYLKNHPEKDMDYGIEHPLPILASIGNGRGGGDYSGRNMDCVGSWAWDEISITKKRPEGMEEICPVFIEDDHENKLDAEAEI